MGRREVIIYVCDWCSAETKPEVSYGVETAPEGWENIDYAMMCPECQVVRKQAIGYARHRRLNGWPLVMDDTKPTPHKSEGPRDD